jgi:antitoxin VapB
MSTKVFKNGRSQAIRIPKEFRVDSDEVYIEKVGDTLVIKPKRVDKWDKLYEQLDDRVQLPTQDRELF